VQSAVGGHLGALVGVVLGVAVGLVAYVAVQAALGAPELPPSLRFGSGRAGPRFPGAAVPPGSGGAT